MKLLVVFLLVASFSHAITCDQALLQLKEGNQRYVDNQLQAPNRSLERRLATNVTQTPFATLLGCSDSRVSPEILFDQGIGDLFIVRVAGNCIGSLEKESIIFSVTNLQTCLIVVLGHQNCGAIGAVLRGEAALFPDIIKHIEPAIVEAKDLPGDPLPNAIRLNVEHVVQELKAFPELARKLAAKELLVVGGIYDLTTGVVTFIP